MSKLDSELSCDELRFIEQQTYYRGVAKIRIEHLQFSDGNVDGAKPLDERNIRRLMGVFYDEGCRPLEPKNRVVGVVDQQQLDRALQSSHVSQADLLDHQIPPFLELEEGIRIRCLYGQHRVAAADRYLERWEKWWVVELYTDGTNPCPPNAPH
jgi:hypothetical protein